MKELWVLVKFVCIINVIGWINSNDGNHNCAHNPGYSCGLTKLATNMVTLLQKFQLSYWWKKTPIQLSEGRTWVREEKYSDCLCYNSVFQFLSVGNWHSAVAIPCYHLKWHMWNKIETFSFCVFKPDYCSLNMSNDRGRSWLNVERERNSMHTFCWWQTLLKALLSSLLALYTTGERGGMYESWAVFPSHWKVWLVCPCHELHYFAAFWIVTLTSLGLCEVLLICKTLILPTKCIQWSFFLGLPFYPVAFNLVS